MSLPRGIIDEGRAISQQHRAEKRVLPEDASPPEPTPQMVPEIMRDHVMETIKTLTPEQSNVAFKLQTRSAAEIESGRRYAFDTRPSIITSWKTHSVLNSRPSSSIFTLADPRRPDADMPLDALAAWAPMIPIPGTNRYTYVPIDEANPVYISARDNSRGYSIYKGVSEGSYGVIYYAMATRDNRTVALKFMKVDPNDLARLPYAGIGHGTVISPTAAAGLFVHYALQRSYGGCMPLTVCLYDTFLFVKPHMANPKGPTNWYIVMAMEKMKGNINQMVRQPHVLDMKAGPKFVEGLRIFAKMTRAIYDLELQSIFHNDIKPANFLYNVDGTVKVTDFDLGCYASRMRTIGYDPKTLLRNFISHFTDGGLNTDDAQWYHDRHFMRCAYQTTEYYEPPEYKLLNAMVRSVSGDRAREIMVNTLNDADWLSRMMAYQLVCSFREIALDAGLNYPYYDHKTYRYCLDVNDISRGYGGGVHAGRYSKMAFAGDVALAPTRGDLSDAIGAYIRLRSSTVTLANIPDANTRKMADNFNSLLAGVIAPKNPTPADTTTEYPMDPTIFMCVSPGKLNIIRPTVGKLLEMLLFILVKLGVTLPDIPPAQVQLHASLEEELAAIRSMTQK